jgi:hypothetical protein
MRISMTKDVVAVVNTETKKELEHEQQIGEQKMTGTHLNYEFEIIKEQDGFYYTLNKDLPIYEVKSRYSQETKELARLVAISHINLIVNGRI